VDVFKLPGDKLTATSAVKHYIPTPTIPANRSITLRNYKISEHYQKEVDAQVQKMLEDQIIQPSQSPWNFPILVVPKKLDASGKYKLRICVDFRKLNDVTVGDSFPLPNIQDILDKLGRARYFFCLRLFKWVLASTPSRERRNEDCI
jgi:mRNA-degrading endonuclease RelE of RelBE toxin-antitoxin system